MSVEAARIVGPSVLVTITRNDMIPDLEVSLSRGWTIIDDAVLLTSWYESYYGDRARFTGIIDYEVAVNGRGIPDMDMVEEGEVRVSRLLRRGVAFAWAALHEQHHKFPHV